MIARRLAFLLAFLALGAGSFASAGQLKKTNSLDDARVALRDNQALVNGLKDRMTPLIEAQKDALAMKAALDDMTLKLENVRASNRLSDAVWFGDWMASVALLTTGGFGVLAESKLVATAAKYVLTTAAVNKAADMAGLGIGNVATFIDKSYSNQQVGRTAGRGGGTEYVKLQQLAENIRQAWKNQGPGDKGRDAALSQISKMIIDLQGDVDTANTTLQLQIVNLAKEAGKWETEGAQIRSELDEYEKKLPPQLRDENAKLFETGKKGEVKAVNQDRQTTVPPPPAAPKESEEDRRRKLQAAIDSYVSAAAKKVTNLNLKADAALDEAMKASLGMGLDAAYPSQRLSELSPDPLCERYEDCVRREKAARQYAEEIDGQRRKTQTYLSDLETKVKPILNVDIAGVLSDWWGVYNMYRPLGFQVAKPTEFTTLGAVDTYLRQGAAAQGFLAQTDKFGQEALDVAARAKEKRGQIVTAAVKFGAELKHAYTDAREARQLFRSEAEKMYDKMNELATPVNGISWLIQYAASYNGDKDLVRLRREIGPMAGSAQKVDDLQWGIATLYNNLYPRLRSLQAMGDDPLMSEYQYIGRSGESEDKSACSSPIPDTSEISAAACTGCAYEDNKSVTPLESLVSSAAMIKHNVVKALRDGEATLSYLEDSDAESLKVLNTAIAALKDEYAGDLSAMKTMTDAEYTAAIEKLDAPVKKAEQQLDAIQQKIRRMPFFDADPQDLKPVDVKTRPSPYGPMPDGYAPLLWQTGFRSKAAQEQYDQLERTKSEFWSKGKGYEIYEARRIAREVAKQNAGPEPASSEETEKVRAFYDRFAKAYESRDDSAVMSLVANDWHAGDGTSMSDLQDNLRRSFRMFDEISFRVENLRVSKLLPYHYQAQYDVTIVSRIYKRNLKHEEKSAVSEEVGSDASGKLKLEGTLNGRYWYVK